LPPPPDGPGPTACGDWPSASRAIEQRYGAIRFCQLVGQTWVLTTEGKPGQTGVIGTYDCDDKRCLDRQTDHPLAGWGFFAPPQPSWVRVVSVDIVAHRITVATPKTYDFDLKTKTFIPHTSVPPQ